MFDRYQAIIERHKTSDLSDSQPTKGNIAGGLTTIEEKALGNIQKIGKKCMVDGVLDYANSASFAYISQMALQNVADMRAQNGAESSRVGFAQDLIKINAINLEAANSRIMDVDVAAESSQLARFQILQQAGTAMLAQANTSQQALVKLLQG